jgi:DNA-binding NarL/FixJ family response regulator
VEQSHESSSRISVAGVDDRPVMLAGLTKLSEISPRISYDASASTVDALLACGTPLDVVLLELSLADGSSPGDNVAKIVAAGPRVLIYTDGGRPSQIAAAVTGGALGVVLKSASLDAVADAVITVHGGLPALTAEMAEALARDALLRPALSERELEVLRSLGMGLADKQIARAMGISEDTVKEYLRRIRAKYTDRGRPAKSRVDLFRRSLEDGVSDNPGSLREIR